MPAGNPSLWLAASPGGSRLLPTQRLSQTIRASLPAATAQTPGPLWEPGLRGGAQPQVRTAQGRCKRAPGPAARSLGSTVPFSGLPWGWEPLPPRPHPGGWEIQGRGQCLASAVWLFLPVPALCLLSARPETVSLGLSHSPTSRTLSRVLLMAPAPLRVHPSRLPQYLGRIKCGPKEAGWCRG